jgi:hypothetical protein
MSYSGTPALTRIPVMMPSRSVTHVETHMPIVREPFTASPRFPFEVAAQSSSTFLTYDAGQTTTLKRPMLCAVCADTASVRHHKICTQNIEVTLLRHYALFTYNDI